MNKLPVMTKKLWRRVGDKSGMISPEENVRWLEAVSMDFAVVASAVDRELWVESSEYSASLEERAASILSEVDFDLGGGGYYGCLYFLTRLFRPRTVVETGVAAGFSSASFLSALERNGAGSLWSSDFPYFRIPDAEKYIGIVVPPELRTDWRLLLEGDERNLPVILDEVQRIDLLHYDSDKSYAGRQFVVTATKDKMSPDGLLVMDDIQDNSYFHDLVIGHEKPWVVLSWDGKYVGIVGDLVGSMLAPTRTV